MPLQSMRLTNRMWHKIDFKFDEKWEGCAEGVTWCTRLRSRAFRRSWLGRDPRSWVDMLLRRSAALYCRLWPSRSSSAPPTPEAPPARARSSLPNSSSRVIADNPIKPASGVRLGHRCFFIWNEKASKNGNTTGYLLILNTIFDMILKNDEHSCYWTNKQLVELVDEEVGEMRI